MKRIGILLTRKCNYQCSHCYNSSHPHGESLNLECVKKIINNFPRDIKRIYFSGGEPFVEKRLLYDALVYLSSQDFPSLRHKDDYVYIITNGFWGRDEAVAKRTIEELLGLNLKFRIELQISYDVFHERQGSRLEYLERIQRIVNDNKVYRDRLQTLILWGGGNFLDLADPVGRAVNDVPRKQWEKRECRGIVKLEPNNYDLVVDFNGRLHGCCELLLPVLGNAVDSPITKILRDVRTNKLSRLLEKKGPRAVASFLGWLKEDIRKEVEIGGDCWLCGKLF